MTPADTAPSDTAPADTAPSRLLQQLRRWLPGLGAAHPRPLPAHRTLALSLGLLLAGLALTPYALGGADDSVRRAAAGFSLTWWQLAVVFACAGVFVFHVEINSEAHTFSLSEVPLALGLFFASPRELVLARLVGEAAVLAIYERQSLPKLAFNLSVFFAEIMAALAIFRSVAAVPDPLAPQAWVYMLLAVGTGAMIGAAAVWAVIRVHGGDVSPRMLLGAALITTIGNTSLAVVAAVLLRADQAALAPLLLVAAIVVAAYRGYSRLTKRYAGLELLYQFTRITSGHQRPEDTFEHVLQEASRLLRTKRALIALYHPGESLPWMYLSSGAEGSDHELSPVPLEHEDLPPEVRRQVLDEGATMLIPRTSHLSEHRRVLELLQAQDCIAAPLVSGGRASGVLIVCDRLGESSTFDGEDARLFTTLASQAAIALENGRLIERLQEQVQAREHEALHDALTKLPNRRLFGESLSQALTDSSSRYLGVLLMDLDGFKDVNDTLGHHIGDMLLCQVAERLRDTIGERGVVARLGGDEFAIMLPHLNRFTDADEVAHEVNAAIRRPVRLAAMTLEIGGSIGVAVWPDHGDDPALLLQRADVAMYAAKHSHQGVSRYDPQTDWNSQQRLQLAGELRQAIVNHEIQVWYQPIARSIDTEVIGAEALSRWNHPKLGRISPDEFIPIAERTGLIHDLTAYVLDQALAQQRAWREMGLEISVAVNLATQVLRDVSWPGKVAELLHKHKVEPRWLTFEITETGIMTDPQRMIGMLHHLATAGITFAIDDFGTGYSSLAYLQQLPVSKVKIDKSFVMPMAGDKGAAMIVKSVIDLAASLGLTVVAEGVEDQRTLELLTELHCDFIQGYFLSRAVPADELTEWITRRNTRRVKPALPAPRRRS
jgi:diguanylate cyclase (GGDEF)-like protein